MDKKLAKILIFLFLLQIFWGYLLLPKLKRRYPLKLMDNDGYIQIALNLQAGYGYKIKSDEAITMRRMPLYPLFLYSVIRILPSNYKNIIKFLQILISLLTSFIIFKALAMLKNKSCGYVGAFLWGVNPLNIFYTPRFYSETLWIFFLSLFIFFLTKFYVNKKEKFLYVATFFLALSILTRAILFLFFPIFLIVLLYFFKEKRIKTFLITSFIFMVTMSPWWIRNYKISKHIILTDTWTYRPILHGISIFENYGKSKMSNWELDQYFSSKYKFKIEKILGGKVNTPQKEIEEEELAKKWTLEKIKSNHLNFLKKGFLGLFRIFYITGSKVFKALCGIFNFFIIFFFFLSILKYKIFKNPIFTTITFLFFFIYIPYSFIFPVLRYSLPLTFLGTIIASISLEKVSEWIF